MFDINIRRLLYTIDPRRPSISPRHPLPVSRAGRTVDMRLVQTDPHHRRDAVHISPAVCMIL
ncbi:hypothetical protein FIBSPDRAFT_862725, partial [Athelia psychrophila]